MPRLQEKRRLERFDLKLPASITLIGHEDREFISLLTSNICSGGVFFHTDTPLEVGTEVKIDFVLTIERLKKAQGKQALIKVSGKVIRSDARGMAICFDKDYQIRSLGNSNKA